MTDHYEMPHPRADECPHAGVGKACRACRDLFALPPAPAPSVVPEGGMKRVSVLAPRIAAGKADPISAEERLIVAGFRADFERKYGTPVELVANVNPYHEED